MKQIKDYDAYIADDNGKRLYTLTEKDKKYIISTLREDIYDMTGFCYEDCISTYVDFKTPDGKYYFNIDVTFNGNFYCIQDWDNGAIDCTFYVNNSDTDCTVCGIVDDEDYAVKLDCATVGDMIIDYFDHIEL